MKQNRLQFMSKLGISAAALLGITAFKADKNEKQMKNVFLHHVYFWLKNPDDKKSYDQLIEGLKKLSQVKTIQQFHIGKPAPTNRDVIERGYAVSWFVKFANDADQASYQSDPIHLRFVEECSPLWSKVIVYDSVDA